MLMPAGLGTTGAIVLSKNKRNCTLLCAVLIGTLLAGRGQSSSRTQYRYPFQDPNLPIERRVSDIVSRLTLEEMIQCLSTNPTVPRLGIQGTGHVEGLHGLALGGPGHWEGRDTTRKPLPVVTTTQFPQARGLGQTWDSELIE